MAIPVVVGTALVNGVPVAIEAAKKYAPAVIEKTRRYVNKAIGKNITDLQSYAQQSPATAQVALEALAKNGLPVDEIFKHIPYLDNQEIAEYRSRLVAIQKDLSVQADADKKGMGFSSDRSDFLRNLNALQEISWACGVLNIKPADLKRLVDVFSNVTERDIENYIAAAPAFRGGLRN